MDRRTALEQLAALAGDAEVGPVVYGAPMPLDRASAHAAMRALGAQLGSPEWLISLAVGEVDRQPLILVITDPVHVVPPGAVPEVFAGFRVLLYALSVPARLVDMEAGYASPTRYAVLAPDRIVNEEGRHGA